MTRGDRFVVLTVAVCRCAAVLQLSNLGMAVKEFRVQAVALGYTWRVEDLVTSVTSCFMDSQVSELQLGSLLAYL